MVGKSRLAPQVFVLHFETIGSATKPTAMSEFTCDVTGGEVVDQRFYGVDEGKHGGSAMCVRVLSGEHGSKRQPGQETRWDRRRGCLQPFFAELLLGKGHRAVVEHG